jgi:formylglycine-generating enzyme required for sulfatase activity
MSGKFALIIANTEYTDPGLAQLTAPGKDAEKFARVLNSPDIAAFDDVIILFNENASKANETIDYFFSLKKPDDLLVLYFSGHGVRDEYGSLYLAVKNTNRARLRSTAIKSDFIREAMDQSRSRRQILILDCCNSGAYAQGTKAETGGSVGTASAFEGTGYGRVVLTASDSTQFAWEGDKVIGETDNSLFTHFLVKGLEGDADRDGDGRITIDELYDYAYEQIVNITPKQTPGKWSYKQQGEIVLRHNIPIEDTKSVPLPDDLMAAINSSLPFVREGAVSQLELLLKGKNLSLARSARLALARIAAEDDSHRVAQAATKALESIPQLEQKEGQKANEDQSASTSRTGQLRRENIAQAAQFKAEQTKLLQEKAELEERLKKERLTLKEPESQPKLAKARWKPIGILGIALLAIVLGGFAMTKFLPSLSAPAPTETYTVTAASTEGISASTEAPISVPVTAKDSPTPTAEAPTMTQRPTAAVTMTASAPSAEKIDSKGVEMVLVPAGDFTMGSNNGDTDENPSHPVSLDAYYIDKFEVTNAQYKACVDAGNCVPPVHSYFFPESPNRTYFGSSQYDNYPVVYVDWNMAEAYCEWRGADLPTEAQWEKAARGDTDARVYPWGKDLDCQKANFQNCVTRTTEVDNYEDGKSQYGVYNMAGNVWEWVADWYSENYYKNSPRKNPSGLDFGQSRVSRGGSWAKYDVRVSNRVNYAPNYINFDVGFRCASGISP